MGNKRMNQASFSEICRIMRDEKCDLHECIKGVFHAALLFLPGLVCQETAFLTNLANGVTLLDAKTEIEKSIKTIANTFGKRTYEDFTTKYEHAQIAQILIVFSAYFDSMKLYLPDEEKSIRLSETEKFILTEKSIAEYTGFLAAKSKEKTAQDTRYIFEYDLSLPNPIESVRYYLDNLEIFYNALNREFMRFYEKLSFWEELKEPEKDKFMAIIRELPAAAAENYKKQYYQLAVTFNDFFVWTNMQQHQNLEHKIDIGFSELTSQLTTYYETGRNTRALTTLEHYRKKYKCYIDEAVIDTTEMDYDPADDIAFPAKKDIFVPQRFKSLVYSDNIHLEETKTWERYMDNPDIGKFISDILRHPVIGALPLLILGHPGAGKSLLCSMLAARILFHEYHVIIVKLRDTIAEQTIQQQINQQIERDFANGCTWDEIAGSGLKKPLLVIFDGYDELLQASGKTYSNYLQRIVEFQKDQKNIHEIFVKCIITSRITLIDKALIADKTPVIMLSDFDTAEIEKWSRIWNDTNRDYFTGHHLVPFKIEKNSRVFELAKQPLLLLMLALFDSNGNALKRNQTLDRTQLYDSLIREFISREKRKSETFKGKQQAEQDEIVEAEMKRISIAALGMYNRKALYLRAAELGKDLGYILPDGTSGKESHDNELSESDKLLGSFFFIHKSDSTDISNRERYQNSAYEFLHNTFGEFLTANYIVSEMYEVLDWILALLQRHKEDKWNPDDQKAWLISLSYAPLFSRPVVVKMINEWSYSFFNGKNMRIENMDKAFDFLLNSEIKRILNGETIFTLKRMLEEKENPYQQEDILKHLATYTINLIILRTILCRKKYLFPFRRETWDKVVSLWKYAFSEDELYVYSVLFRTTVSTEGYQMLYLGTEGNNSIVQDRIMKLANISSALGDETMFGIITSLLGTDGILIDELLDLNHLSVTARYWWHYLLNRFALRGLQQDTLLPVLSDFYDACWMEKDYQSLFSFYLLLHFLLKTNIIQIDWTTNELIQDYVMKGVSLSSYSDVLVRTTFEKTIFFRIAELAIDLLDYIIPGERCLEKIFTFCLSRKHYERFGSAYGLFYTGTLYNQILTKIITNRQHNDPLKTSPDYIYIGEYLKLALHAIRTNRRLSKEILFHNFEIAYHLLSFERYQESSTLFRSCIETFAAEDSKQIPRIPLSKKILMIDYLYEMFRRDLFSRTYTGMVLEKIIQYADIKKVFPDAPETVGHLLFLLDVQMFMNLEKVNRDLLWLAKKYRYDFSWKLYIQIHRFAQKMKLLDLLDLLDEMISYYASPSGS